jgi:hypothetical protein
MYDYYTTNNIAQRKHQELIDQAAHDALVRNLRRQNRKSNHNPLLVAITNLLAR